MQRMQDERVLQEAGGTDNKLTLTTHRVRYETRLWGDSRLTGIMLEDLVSCAFVRQNNPLLVVLASVALLATIIAMLRGDDTWAPLGAVAVVVLLVLYVASRRHLLFLESAGAKIVVNVAGMRPQQVEAFIEAVEAAKNQRYLLQARSVSGAMDGVGGLPAALGKLSGQLAAVVALTDEIGKDAKATGAQVTALVESTRAIAIMLHRELGTPPLGNGVGRH